MFRRLWSVLLTYFTRPMMLALGASYALAFAGAIFAAFASRPHRQEKSVSPEIWFRGKTISIFNQPGDQPDLDRVTFDPAVVTVGIYGQNITARYLRKLLACPNLRALRLENCPPPSIGDDEAAALGELKQLESLSLSGNMINQSIWRQLGKLPKLRYLDLSCCSMVGDYPDLESFSQLETLVLGQSFVENKTPFLPELKRLPRLKALLLQNYYSSQAVRIQHDRLQARPNVAEPLAASNALVDGLDHLRDIASLRVLYVDDRSPQFPGYEKLQRELPLVQVRPFIVDSGRLDALGLIYILGAILVCLLALQIHSQFSHPGSRLIPHYTVSHVAIVVAIWSLGAMANTIPLLLCDVSFLPALGLSVLPWAILCSLRLGMLTVLPNASHSNGFLMISLLSSSVAIVPHLQRTLAQRNLLSVDWYLRGHEAAWAWLFIVSGIVASAAYLRKSLLLHVSYMELGVDSPPLSLDRPAMAKWQQRFATRHQAAGSNAAWSTNWISRRLTRAIINATRAGWKARSNLWIAGNYANGNSMLTIFSILAVTITLTCYIFCEPSSSDDVVNFVPRVLPIVALIPNMLAFTVMATWRERCKLFATESLRPVSRCQFSREIATAIAWDLLPLGGISPVVLTWCLLQADFGRWSVIWTLAMLLFFVAQWMIIYCMTLWAIAIRRDWVVGLAAFIMGNATLLASIAIAIVQTPWSGAKQLPPAISVVGIWVLASSAILLGIVGCVLARLAYRRWQSIELA